MCIHNNRRIETDEDHYGNRQEFYVCDDCGCELPYEVADLNVERMEYFTNIKNEE